MRRTAGPWDSATLMFLPFFEKNERFCWLSVRAAMTAKLAKKGQADGSDRKSYRCKMRLRPQNAANPPPGSGKLHHLATSGKQDGPWPVATP